MTDEEIKRINDRVLSIEKRLSYQYDVIRSKRGETCFLARNKHYFKITGLPWPDSGQGALVIEHAFGDEEYAAGRFEDGDLFFMDEMSEDEMLDAILREINDT